MVLSENELITNMIFCQLNLDAFTLACKWKRNYGGWKVDEAWFILTDLGSAAAAINAYKQRMGIEEMFRDFKTGGYDIEGTSLKGNRLINMILLMALAYLKGIF